MTLRDNIANYLKENKVLLNYTVTDTILGVIYDKIDELIQYNIKTAKDNGDIDDIYFDAKITGMKEAQELLK